ncbi:MAG: carbohydrate binding domain-containing protein [Candidatus Kerfeldbacteria bacterium]|nr:carbohydrate binding domain-containing protein [Candidatus Kerfeldbacteria bacterium]
MNVYRKKLATKPGTELSVSDGRASRSPTRRTLPYFAVPFATVVVIGSLLLLPRAVPVKAFFPPFLNIGQELSTVVGVGVPVTETGSIPQAKTNIVNRIRERLKDLLKVAGDVAYKTGVRIFYQQLTNVTTEFIRTAGTGQKPIFITDPHYWEKVFDAAQNDFLDSVGKQVFGIELSRPLDAEKEKQIGLLVRGILNPGTVCEDDCQKRYNEKQVRIKEIQQDLGIVKRMEPDPNVDPNCPKCIPCPIAGDPNKNPAWDSKGQQFIDKKKCQAVLGDILSIERAQVTRDYTNCTNSCRRQRGAVRTDPILKEVVGNEAVAAAVQEYYDPRKNDFGNILAVLNKAADRSQSAVRAEQTAFGTNIAPSRTTAGIITAPAVLVEERAKKALQTATNDVDIVTGSRIADVISKAIGNALIQRITREWFNRKCGLNPDACRQPVGTSPQARFLFGNQPAQLAADIKPVQIGRNDIVLGEPSRNPVPTADILEASGLIDSRFRQAIEQRLTVREALDQGFLDATRTFGYDREGKEPLDGYPYQSILYLKKSRIVPVGWQLVAEYIRQAEPQDTSLGELINQFSMCGQDAAHDADPAATKACSNNRTQVCAADRDCTPTPGGTCLSTTSTCVGGPQPGAACTSDVDCAFPAPTCMETYSPSPFCGLVDPDWVLKAPLTYCRKQGAGEELVTRIFLCDEDTNANGRIDCSEGVGGGDIGHFEIQRKDEVCVDEPTCVAENEDGSCLSYGYCFQDRRTFRFDGDRCPSYYASCQAYADPDGNSVSFLKKTIDVNGCSSDSAGCSAFCSDRRDKDGSWLCTSDPGRDPAVAAAATKCPVGETCTCRLPSGETCTVGNGTDNCTTNSGARCTLGANYSYFDRDVEVCSETDAGCREFIDANGSANLLANGGFELFEGTADDSGAAADDVVKGWGGVTAFISTSHAQVVTSDLGVTNNNKSAVRLPATGGSTQGLVFTNDRPSNTPARQGIDTGRPLSFRTFTLSYYGRAENPGTSCSGAYGLRAANSSYVTSDNAVYTPTWTRFSTVITWPDRGYDNNPDNHVVQAFVEASSDCNVLIDNVQLEAADQVSAYADYGTANLIYLNADRRTCDRVDVGCEKYTPVTGGGEAITGVVNTKDRCSAEVVGCKQYRKEAIDHIPFRAAVDPLNLVPTSARQCRADQVGCEEYTNLDVLAQGGEAREFFTAIRQCVKPVTGAADQATYFTWVGDDRTGFQLKSFRLKQSNVDGGPCTNIALGTSTSDNNPACVDAGGANSNIAQCDPADVGVNPDCAQYFDSSGNVFHRRQSRTVPVSDDCHPYRNTIDERNNQSNVYLVLARESTTCAAEAAECRAFTGNAGSNTRVIVSYNFENSNAVSADWQYVGAGSNVSPSPASVSAGGKSMSATGTVATQDHVLQDKLQQNKSYTLSFWASPDSATTLDAYLLINGTVTRPIVTSLNLASEWHPYTVGPVTVDVDPQGVPVQLRLTLRDGSGNPATAYLDNLQLREITDSLFLIDNSFRTCADADLGCEAYVDRANARHNLKSFTRLCSPDVLGCSALIDTQNSSSPFLSLPLRGVQVPADATVSLVNEKNAQCSADAKGCTAFGQPTLNVSKRVGAFQTVYLKDQPDKHLQILCTANELSCTEYTADSGSKEYFKNPGAQTCEFKRLTGDTGYHWYITGTTFRCPVNTPPTDGLPTGRACVKTCTGGERGGLACVSNNDCLEAVGICSSGICQGGGANDGTSCSANSDCLETASCTGDDAVVGRTCRINADCGGGLTCDSWVGSCPEEQSGCNEYRDPSDPKSCRTNCPLELSGGKPLYVDDSCQPTVCRGGKKDGDSCRDNSDCPGVCSNAALACTSSSQCPSGGTCSTATCSGEGIPGCRSYYYLKQTIEQNAAECNGRVDIANGCRPFNDTSNQTLNFRAF